MTKKHLPPLDLTGPASQVADRWRNWKGIDSVRKKTSQLLHFAEKAQKFRSKVPLAETFVLPSP